MENKDKPAFYNPNSYFMQGDDGNGLTKREYFACHIATGLSVQAIAGSHNGIKEMEVEIKMEPCYYDQSLGAFSTSYTEDKPVEQPKLDKDGCLILTKKK